MFAINSLITFCSKILFKQLLRSQVVKDAIKLAHDNPVWNTINGNQAGGNKCSLNQNIYIFVNQATEISILSI